MNILILNHHFDYDIEALINESNGKHNIKTIRPEYFSERAELIFPSEVFSSDLTVYHKKKYKKNRLIYRKKARKLFFELYKVFQFDVFISPSSVFFYIRDVLDACDDLNVGIVIFQKELGVAKDNQEHLNFIINKYFPVHGDLIATCSEDSKNAWIKMGADPKISFVTGQPRFDYYFNLPKNTQTHNKTYLFFSYFLHAYVTSNSSKQDYNPWTELCDNTIECLAKLAVQNPNDKVLIKPHPQQDVFSISRIYNQVKNIKNIEILNSKTDSRKILVDSDIIISFQSSVLLEALILNKKVIYTYWTEEVNKLSKLLLPFHKYYDFLSVSKSKEDFCKLLSNTELIIGGKNLNSIQIKKRIKSFNSFFGDVKGDSSKRLLNLTVKMLDNKRKNIKSSHINLKSKILNDKDFYLKKELYKSKICLCFFTIFLKFSSLLFSSKKLNNYFKKIISMYEKRILELNDISQVDLELIGNVNTNIKLYSKIYSLKIIKYFK
tara:strand:- start:6383 stop:7861 length:1479 start_codon:yes stop_codon:yes gene_type:complete